MSAQPSMTFFLEATIDDNDSSTNGTLLETPSVVNGVGESWWYYFHHWMPWLWKSREKILMKAREQRGDGEKQDGVAKRMMCPVADWKWENLQITR